MSTPRRVPATATGSEDRLHPWRRCQVVPHRGGAGEVPENTWSAVEHVVELGLAWLNGSDRKSVV